MTIDECLTVIKATCEERGWDYDIEYDGPTGWITICGDGHRHQFYLEELALAEAFLSATDPNAPVAHYATEFVHGKDKTVFTTKKVGPAPAGMEYRLILMKKVTK